MDGMLKWDGMLCCQRAPAGTQPPCHVKLGLVGSDSRSWLCWEHFVLFLPFADGVRDEEAGFGWEEAELISHSVCKYCPAALGTPQQWHHPLHVNETERGRGTPLHTVAYLLCTLNWYLCWGDLLSKPAASSAFPGTGCPGLMHFGGCSPQSQASPQKDRRCCNQKSIMYWYVCRPRYNFLK